MPVNVVPEVWERFGVGKTVKAEEWRAGGRFSAQSAYEAILAEQNQLWLVIEHNQNIKAILITDLTPYPGGEKICTVTFAAGKEVRSWMPLISVLEDWARENGCTRLEVWGRMGWRRVLKDYEPAMILLEKNLSDEEQENH